MKRTKKRLTFAAVAAGTALAATLAGCRFPGQEPINAPYGPPPSSVEDPDGGDWDLPISDGAYDPASEEPQEVYGPPPAGIDE